MGAFVSRPLLADDLPTIDGWFDDPETVRWLGGRDWPRTLLRLADEPGRSALLFVHLDEPVALLDVDRDGASAAIAVVVAPTRRGEGVARSILQSIFSLAATREVVRVVAEIEEGNTASEGLLRAARFELEGVTQEGFARYVLRRSAAVEPS